MKEQSNITWIWVWFALLVVAYTEQGPKERVPTRVLGGCKDAPNDFNCLARAVNR